MKYNTQHLLDWFQTIPFTDIIRIFPHSQLMILEGDYMEEELMHLEEVWCRKSTEERDMIKQEVSTKSWEDLSWKEQEVLEHAFFITTDKTNLFIDEHKRPYVQTTNGKEYCSARKSYDYSVKN
jgi:hypothetical protein